MGAEQEEEEPRAISRTHPCVLCSSAPAQWAASPLVLFVCCRGPLASGSAGHGENGGLSIVRTGDGSLPEQAGRPPARPRRASDPRWGSGQPSP